MKTIEQMGLSNIRPDFPNKLFRYLGHGQSGDWLKEVFSGTLRFKAPGDFNDPFECNPIVLARDFKTTQKHFIQSGKQLGLSPAKRLLLGSQAARMLSHPRRLSNLGEMSSRLMAKIGILCLAESNLDLLMWSHYADGHRGLCLEFDTSYDFFAVALKVTYSDTYPSLDHIQDSTDEMSQAAYLSKAKCWEYENEWRILKLPLDPRLSGRSQLSHLIDATHGPGDHQYPQQALTAVYLGAAMPEKHQSNIEQWIKETGSTARVIRGRFSDTGYGVIFK